MAKVEESQCGRSSPLWRALKETVPGFVAGAVCCSIESSYASALWIIWLWVRVVRFYAPPIPYGEILFGSFAAGTNLTAYLYDVRDLQPAYAHFLTQCGGSNRLGLDMIKQIRLVPNTEHIHKFCHIMHPNEPHHTFWMRSFYDGMSFGAKVQFPLHVITHLSLGAKASLKTSLISLVRASLFLGAYPSLAMFMICNWWRITGRTSEPRWFLALMGMGVGASLFVESPGRRKEIAAFTFTHSLLTFWRQYVGRKTLTSRRADVGAKLLFSAAMSCLMTPTLRQAQPGLLQWATK